MGFCSLFSVICGCKHVCYSSDIVIILWVDHSAQGDFEQVIPDIKKLGLLFVRYVCRSFWPPQRYLRPLQGFNKSINTWFFFFSSCISKVTWSHPWGVFDVLQLLIKSLNSNSVKLSLVLFGCEPSVSKLVFFSSSSLLPNISQPQVGVLSINKRRAQTNPTQSDDKSLVGNRTVLPHCFF